VIAHVIGYPCSGKTTFTSALAESLSACVRVIDPPKEFEVNIGGPTFGELTQEWELANWLRFWINDLAGATTEAIARSREDLVVIECSPALHAMLPRPETSVWLPQPAGLLRERLRRRDGLSVRQAEVYLAAHCDLAACLLESAWLRMLRGIGAGDRGASVWPG
jgi:hypothetical protein